MLVDNRKLIRAVNEKVYHRLLQVEQAGITNVIVEPGKKEGETLALIRDGKRVYLTSKYSPISEAHTFNQAYENLATEHLLFIGVGMGYHVMELLERYPKATYAIYEPNVEVLATFLAKHDLSKRKAQLITVFTNEQELQNFSELVKSYISKGTIIRWVPTLKLYEQEITEFEQEVAEVLKYEGFSLGINAAHQQRWQVNGIINFPKILKTPHLFDMDMSQLENKPVVIVSAGPSLSFDIEYIREIKEKKKAYIFAVGSAINALIEADVLPDVFVSFDPKIENNSAVFKRVKEQQLPIPLFFGSTIGHETLENYPGSMYHFFVKQESISTYFLDTNSANILTDKPSVAVQAFEICAKLKMSPIIFAGQNCAFLNNKRYASEIKYTHVSEELTEAEKEKLIEVESVDGEIIYTNLGNYALLKTLEQTLKSYNLNHVYNTTKQGAKITGAPFVEIEQVIATKLVKDNIVTDGWMKAENDYNIQEVLKRYDVLEASFDELFANLKSIIEISEVVIEKNSKKVYSNLHAVLVKFDHYYHLIHANLFFRTIIESMMRVQKQNFLAHSHEVKIAKSEKQKAEKFIAVYIPYIRAMLANVLVVQDGFKELKQIKTFNGNGES